MPINRWTDKEDVVHTRTHTCTLTHTHVHTHTHTREQQHREPAPCSGHVCSPSLSLGEGFLCDTINIGFLVPFLVTWWMRVLLTSCSPLWNGQRRREMCKVGGDRGQERTHPRGFLLSVGVFVPSHSFKTVGGCKCDFFFL